MKIGVLGGGISSEREISLISAQEVLKALRRRNIEAEFIDIVTHDKERIKELITASAIDCVFIALHGAFGEDGQIQHILEELAIPYTGSPPIASYLAMDKIASKKIFVKEDIPTPAFIVWEDRNSLPPVITYPCVVKPYFAGSSLGVSVVRKEYDLEPLLKKAFSFNDKVIIEDYIEGRELTVGILEEKPLPIIEIIPKKGYFDFQTKYNDGIAEFRIPAELDAGLYRYVQGIALKAHTALGLRHFSRADMILDRNDTPYVLEVNSIPGLTSHSLLPLAAKAAGIGFDELILKMLSLALTTHKVSNV